MLLAIDVGNTQIVVGLFADNDGVGTGDLVHHWRVATHPQYTADEFALQLSQLLALDDLDFSSVTGTVVACVVPPVQAALRQMTARRLNVPTVIVEPGVRTGMPVLVDNPKEVGADRIADAVAAFERDLLQDALKSARGNRARAARLLQTTERIFNYKVRKYGIRSEGFAQP